MLDDCEGALQDLDKVNVLEPNNASTLRTHENVKYMFEDYQGALETLIRLMFLTQTMHSL
jgi:hypothetical protein